jgi:hypothetical protein
VGSFAPRVVDAARQKLVVLGIEARDEGDARSRQKTAALAKTLSAELRARGDASGYELGPARDLLELKLLSDCLDENPACMAAIGRQVGAEVLIFGHLEKKGSSLALTLFRLDVAQKAVRALEAPAVAAATDDGMRRAAAGVSFNPTAADEAPDPPRLVVHTNVPAKILVGGLARGSTAEGQALVVNDLPGGTTRLAVEALVPGRKRWENPIDVRPRGRTEVTVNLEEEPREEGAVAPAPAPVAPPEPEPIPQPVRGGKTARVLFWTSLVATGAGVAAFTITGLQVRSIEKEQNAAIAEWGDGYKVNGVQYPGDACAEARHDGFAKLVDICDRGQNMATVTNVLIGATAAAAIASAIFYWRGYLAASDELPPSVGTLRQAKIAPTVYKNGAGVDAVIQF